MNKRTDIQTAIYIEAAISVSRSHGLAPAARSLAERGIPLAIAMRVLTRPAERRVMPLPAGRTSH